MRRSILVILIAVAGLLPPALFWFFVGRAPTVTVDEARRLLADPNANAVLVDTRTPAEFVAGHVDGAINWPLSDLRRDPGDPPAGAAGRKRLLVCSSGLGSAWGALRLNESIATSAVSVRGGMQEWAIAAPATMRVSPLYEQWVAVVSGFGFKAVYMLLTLVLVWVLRRQRSPDLVALRWAMICFFFGEAACLLNFLLYAERSYLFEYLHGFGMALTFGFTTYAMLEGIDLRLIHYSDASGRCAAAALCRGCIKHAAVPCALRRVFLMVIPAAAAVASVPLFAPFHMEAYTTTILGTPYTYMHETVHQVYEIRLLPIMGIAMLCAAMGVLAFKERHPVPLSKALFAAGVGAMGFSWFRFVLLAAFAENQVWFGFWEEATELIYILAAGAALVIFRHGLFREVETRI